MKRSKKLWFHKAFKITVIVLLVLGLSLVGLVTYAVRQSFPVETGTVQIPGLKAEVKVERNDWGIPHIYAANSHDLFMAQGYVHAQDRFWQMDFHMGQGDGL
ncbi:MULTISPECIES: penicillin acylase family protein [Brasilonema]|uniref:penicillin acylase family protein n=1 Tax=Brasilonema TaxID=383614 RepID=UPI001FE92D2B|nr:MULTISPECIES: penicillin acylase family protein [Brasilonema]